MDDFMKRLELILEADTIDLRRLAEIGGCDPATFYVGTRLDGVDVRGQDLRGMKLSGLDPIKVRKDEDTRLPAPPPLPPRVEMLVYTAAETGPRFVPDRDVWARHFGLQEQNAFLQAAEGFHGAVVVLAPAEHLGSAFSIGKQLSRMDRGHVCLALDPEPNRSRTMILAREAGPYRRVIKVQSSLFRTGASGNDLRLLLKLLRRSRHWEAILHMAPEPVSYFTRAVIRRATEPLDAAAAIFDRAAALDLSTTHCMMFVPRKTTWTRDKNDWQAWLRPHYVTSSLDDRALAALLPSPRSMTHRDDYASSLAEMMSRTGWPEVRTTHGQGDVELILPLTPDEISIPVIDHLSLKDTRVPLERASLRHADLTDANRVVISPDVGAGAVAYGVINHHVLALSARDLLASPGQTASLWTLVGAQFSRVQDEAPHAELVLYVRLLLASAFNRGTVHHGDADLLKAIIEGDTPYLDLVIVHLERVDNEVRAILAIIDSRAPRGQRPKAIAHILIDNGGVAVSDDPLLRSIDQRAPGTSDIPRLL